jgi:hypothetical protein
MYKLSRTCHEKLKIRKSSLMGALSPQIGLQSVGLAGIALRLREAELGSLALCLAGRVARLRRELPGGIKT